LVRNTSDVLTSLWRIATPSADFASSTIDRFERLSTRKQ